MIDFLNDIVEFFFFLLDFVVRPDFTLKIFEESQIEIRLKSLLPTAMCVKRITPQLKLNDVQVCEKQSIVLH